MALDLVENPSSCPPFPPDMVRMRIAMHGGSGSYVDEPGRVPASSESVESNMETATSALATLDVMVRLLSQKEAEIDRLRSLLAQHKIPA